MYYQKNNQRKLRNVTQQNIVITPPDRVFTVGVVFLVVFGLMSVFSASVPKCVNAGYNTLHYAYPIFVQEITCTS